MLRRTVLLSLVIILATPVSPAWAEDTVKGYAECMFEPGGKGSEDTVGRIIEDGPQAERMPGIMRRLAPPSVDFDRQLRVYLVDTEEWNAAAMGNGAICVYTGLAESVSDDESNKWLEQVRAQLTDFEKRLGGRYEPDDYPVLQFEARGPGVRSIRAHMASCSTDTCVSGIRRTPARASPLRCASG